MKARYVSTPDIDEKIKSAYFRQRQGDRCALTAVRRDIGWSKAAIVRRGAMLCLTRTKERPWSPAEEEILEKRGHLTAPAIQQYLAREGYGRSSPPYK